MKQIPGAIVALLAGAFIYCVMVVGFGAFCHLMWRLFNVGWGFVP